MISRVIFVSATFIAAMTTLTIASKLEASSAIEAFDYDAFIDDNDFAQIDAVQGG